ncbi:hypothetical protein JRQ81_001045, partial [Phrynocephalus forsythii]
KKICQDSSNFHSNMNLTLEQSMQQGNVLATTVKLQHGQRSTTLYQKSPPPIYLHGFHPEHTTKF